ncbi:MAG: hypothetical protein FJZ38_11980 [Candidatus Rokubacteria bacterium]|nr:hypothetical protein [Candidatus Rokubacteria bacterium]
MWHELTLVAFRAARAMSASGRESTGQRMESAALAAAREREAGRTAAAAESLQEMETLLAIAAELGDVAPAARDAVQAAITAARTSLGSAG